MSYVLAIDVGTSYTAAALIKPSGSSAPTPEILPLGIHGNAVPSVLFYADDGRILVGEAAERRGLDDPRRMVREFKRRIGDSVPLAVGEAWMSPEDVYATMARWVVDRAEEREGCPPSSIVLTHPAVWGGHRTSTVLAALNAAGLRDATLISEPVAAALHYATQTRVEDGSTVAVYDLGGGTFDTAVLRKAGAGRFELLGRPDGIETLGGADFDAAVLRHVVGQLGDALAGIEPEAPESKAALSRLRRECREAKEALSMDSEASIAVALPGIQRTLRLVRSEFEALIEAPIRETVHALDRSLRSMHIEPKDLSAVLLIGGSSRIPLVAEMISVELDRPIAVDADPKSSICLGAAVAGLGMGTAADKYTVESAAALPAAPEGNDPPERARAARPHIVNSRPHFGAVKAATTPGGAHRSHVRLAAAAVAAATALTIATATAAQSPEGSGMLASMFGSQAADVMRGDGPPVAAAQANGGGGGGAGAVPAVGGPTAGLEASARAGVTRAGTGTGKSPARSGSTGNSGPGAGSGTATGPSAGTGAVGTGNTAATGGAAATGSPAGATTPGTPGSGSSNPPVSTPTPEPTGGAASGPTPPPATTPPTVPPPATDPTTPPVVPTDPVIPSPEPTVPQPEPTATQDPVPPSPEPTVPQPEPTIPPATLAPEPLPTETSPAPDPALTPAV